MCLRIALFLFCCPFLLSAQVSETIEYADGLLHYEIYGSGEPLLIINGGPGMNSQGFRSLAKTFGDTHQAIIYDQRGTGESVLKETNQQTIAIYKMVEDIEVLRKHLKIEKWHILGHSFGGMLASYYAALYPDHIEGLILSASGGINLDLFNSLDIRGRLTETELDSLNYWANKISGGDSSYYARLQRGKFLAPAYLYDKSHVPVIAERLTQSNFEINRMVFLSMQAINFDCSLPLMLYKKPVLIIQGKQDIIDASIAEYAHQTFPNSKLVFLDHCGHYGWLDQRDAYFSAIYRFLDRVELEK